MFEPVRGSEPARGEGGGEQAVPRLGGASLDLWPSEEDSLGRSHPRVAVESQASSEILDDPHQRREFVPSQCSQEEEMRWAFF